MAIAVPPPILTRARLPHPERNAMTAIPPEVVSPILTALLFAGLVAILAVIIRWEPWRARPRPLARPVGPGEAGEMENIRRRRAKSPAESARMGAMAFVLLWGVLWFGGARQEVTSAPYTGLIECDLGCLYGGMRTWKDRWGSYNAPNADGQRPMPGPVDYTLLGMRPSEDSTLNLTSITPTEYVCVATNIYEYRIDAISLDQTGTITFHGRGAGRRKANIVTAIWCVLAVVVFGVLPLAQVVRRRRARDR